VNLSIAVVIVNWNSKGYLKICLQALRTQSLPPTQIIVVDNASTDHSVQDIATFAPKVTLIKLPQNIGFAAANNLAIKQFTKCEWVALLNPDAFPAFDWLENFFQATVKYSACSFFGSRLISANEPELLDGAGDSYHVSGLVWRRGHGCLAANRYMTDEEIFSPCAAAAFYRRQAFLEVGGFDERYFCYVEDIDLGFRLRLQGHYCLYLADAIVHHVGSASSGRHSDFTVYHGHRNYVWTYVKNMPTFLFWAFLLPHIFVNLASLLLFSLRGQSRIIIKSKWNAIIGIPTLWKERSKLQRSRVASVRTLWRIMDKHWIARRPVHLKRTNRAD
jgi:GT2 family glycosyltransferase